MGKLYVNGELVATNTMTLHLKDVGTLFAAWIGRSSYTSSSDYLSGRQDDFRIYNRAMDQKEINNLAYP